MLSLQAGWKTIGARVRHLLAFNAENGNRPVAGWLDMLAGF